MPAHDADWKQAFFDAVRRRDLAAAQAAAETLQARLPVEPRLAAWARYFEGVLANERDHDLAAGERIFLEVAQGADADLELQGRLWLALALTCCRQNRLQACLDYSERSLACCRARGDAAGQAKALKQQVIALATGFDQGLFGPERLPAIEQHCRAALALLEDAPLTEETQWLAGTLWNEIGAYHRARQEWEQAAAAYRRNLAICEAINHRSGVAVAYGNLGELLFKQGAAHWPEAEADFRHSLAVAEDAGFRGQQLDALVNLAYLQGQAGRFAEALESYRAAIALIDTLRAGVSSETARAGFFSTVTETFANAVLAAVAADQPEEALYLSEQARARAFLDLLAAGHADLYGQTAAALPAAALCDSLSEDEALLSFFTTGLLHTLERHSAAAALDRHRFPPACVLIFLATRAGVQVWRSALSPNDLQPRQLTGAVERHFLNPTLRRTLYTQLIEPVAAALAGKRRVILAPHGPLHYVPFHALLAPDGHCWLREHGPDVVYTPSGSAFFAVRPTAPQPAAPLSCLALGYNGDGEHDRLRFAEEEALMLAARLGGEAAVGPGSKRALLLALAPRARVLHISCHGEFDAAAPLQSCLHLGADESLSAHDVLQGLRLPGTLVALSACESGLSEVCRGDELMGLVRAFLAAGASAVLASLWRVDERSTRLLMELFYAQVAADVEPGHALRRAQLALRTLPQAEVQRLLGADAPAGEAAYPFADPFYWAAFVLITRGEERTVTSNR